jgi:Na+(H+)/acetate symporter ActP
VAAFVLAGAIAAGISTLNGNLMAIAALVGSDILGIWAPTMEKKKKLRIGFVCLGIGGFIALMLAFNPPTFLVTSILWAFGLLSTTATPGILLGVWWKQANKYALLVSSTICGFLYILISPHVFKGFVLGKGLTAALGMSEALLTVPLSFVLFIVLSVTFNKMGWAPSQEEKAVLDRIHGWNDYDENRYNGRVWPWVTVAVCLVICWWALQPWK